MNRKEWKFKYLSAALAKAAHEKAEFHKARLGVWEAKDKEVKDKIRSEGIELSEGLVEEMYQAKLSNSNLARSPTVKIRDDLLDNLRECTAKIREHREKLRDYSAWEQVLGSDDPEATHELHHDDWLFFFGR